ncbi:hypothetical protein N2152v2_004628 [Parachlorella kessleri]
MDIANQRYDFVRDIGSGNFGVAKLMRDKRTGELVAVKFIPRGEKIDKNVERELLNHRMLSGHPMIIRFREGVCHRDLKLENTLLDGRPAPRLKICDFGYSKSAVFDSQPKSTVGTPAYIAPEVLSRKQYDGEVADVWSCGVTLYVMLVGAYPFEDPADPRNFRKTIQRIMSVKYSFPANLHLSKECLDLISRIFVANPTQRIKIKEIQQHPWFLKNLPEELKDGGLAMRDAAPQCTQNIEDIRQMVHAARSKAQTPAVNNVRDFNEEDYMDGDLMDEELVE